MRTTIVTCDICKEVIPIGNSIYYVNDPITLEAPSQCYDGADSRKLLDACEMCYSCAYDIEKAVRQVIESKGEAK